MNQPNRIDEIERLLVMAAAVHGLGPKTDLSRANTARIVDQVLRWLGLSTVQIQQDWREAEAQEEEAHSINDEVYDVLVRMVHEPNVPLFKGSGNWGVPGDPACPPAWPHFNSCRLTARGQQVATKLLALHPEYRKTT